MIIACSHPNGLNLGGVVARGPAQLDDPPELYAGYALTDVPDSAAEWIDEWAAVNARSQIVSEGVVVWGANRDEVRLKILNGRQGRGFVA
jgi:hypothetical protein